MIMIGLMNGRQVLDPVLMPLTSSSRKKENTYIVATMDNDAKSCYDRIICNLAMVISQYYGVSHNMASLQAKTMKNMKFRLHTALGDSIRTYQHLKTTPIHGTGQGTCASPAIWLLIRSILMDCLSELGGGIMMRDVQDNIHENNGSMVLLTIVPYFPTMSKSTIIQI
jgi:hypothetical protein